MGIADEAVTIRLDLTGAVNGTTSYGELYRQLMRPQERRDITALIKKRGIGAVLDEFEGNLRTVLAQRQSGTTPTSVVGLGVLGEGLEQVTIVNALAYSCLRADRPYLARFIRLGASYYDVPKQDYEAAVMKFLPRKRAKKNNC